jgi:hypothetical protein
LQEQSDAVGSHDNRNAVKPMKLWNTDHRYHGPLGGQQWRGSYLQAIEKITRSV